MSLQEKAELVFETTGEVCMPKRFACDPRVINIQGQRIFACGLSHLAKEDTPELEQIELELSEWIEALGFSVANQNLPMPTEWYTNINFYEEPADADVETMHEYLTFEPVEHPGYNVSMGFGLYSRMISEEFMISYIACDDINKDNYDFVAYDDIRYINTFKTIEEAYQK